MHTLRTLADRGVHGVARAQLIVHPAVGARRSPIRPAAWPPGQHVASLA